MLSLIGLSLLAAPASASHHTLPPHSNLPQQLPQAGAQRSSQASWILGLRPGPVVADLLRHGQLHLSRDRSWVVVPISQARPLARLLAAHGELRYSEPNEPTSTNSALDADPQDWARAAVVPFSLPWPSRPLRSIAIIDESIDPEVRDFAAGQVRYLNAEGQPPSGWHGTAVASVAAAVYGNGGVFGVLPGAPLLSYQPSHFNCAELSDGVAAAIAAGASIVNISLGSRDECFTLFRALEKAIAADVMVVAAAGNEYTEGNPVMFPAAYPHVVSVAALTPELRSASFSTSNGAVDLSAPGVDVPVALPPSFDDDGHRDGIALVNGTSFSAPMVAGAAAWLRTTRPELTASQAADLLRQTATDLGRPGWDADTGFGLVNLARALIAPEPLTDPLEPNDSIALVNGSIFDRSAPYLWGNGPPTKLWATVDDVKDPLDVYRLRLPPRSKLTVTVKPATVADNPDLEVYSGHARRVGDRRQLLASSARSSGHHDRVIIANPTRLPRRAYLAIWPNSPNSPRAAYLLDVRRR